MRKTLNTFIEYFLFFALLTISFLLAVDKTYSHSVLDGLSLWLACVLPSLFPYFFITSVLSALKVTGKFTRLLSPATTTLFGIGGCAGYAFFMSIVSGYPVGAKLVSDLAKKGLLSESEKVRASAVCSTSSPMFLIGSVGNLMFGSSLFGFALFISHLLAVITTGIIFSFYNRSDRPNTRAVFHIENPDNVFYDSIYSSVLSVLVVGGTIALFYLLTEMLLSLSLLSLPISLLSGAFNKNIADGLVLGIFECTKGLKAVAEGGITFFSLPVCAALCSFGGISVIAQSLAFLKSAKIKTAPFILSKILVAVIGFCFGCVFSLIFF